MHLKKCRSDGSKYSKIKLGEKYPCSICHEVSETVSDFKKHCFFQHTDADVLKYYNMSLEELIGKYELGRLRGPFMTTIRKGKLEEFAIVLLDQRAPFHTGDIEARLPIQFDQSPESQQARKSLYTQKRDLLMKISETRVEG